MLLDLKQRGLTIDPQLAIADGALGFWKAIDEVWPKTRARRCWMHKTVNVLNRLPNSLQARAKRALQDIWMAQARKAAEAALDAFVKSGVKYEMGVECLTKGREVLFAFYDFPAEHWPTPAAVLLRMSGLNLHRAGLGSDQRRVRPQIILALGQQMPAQHSELAGHGHRGDLICLFVPSCASREIRAWTETLDLRRRLLDGIDKNKGAGWRFIEHTVPVVGFMIELETRHRPDIRVLERSEILDSAPKSRSNRRVKLSAEIQIGGMLHRNAVVLDAFFGLRFHDDEESYFMLEYDRGEMSIERYRSPYQTYFAKKIATYYEAFRRGQHRSELGIENFRVLTVTTTSQRVERMRDSLLDLTDGLGSNLFLFTDQAAFAATNPLDLIWTSGKAERLRIID